MLALYLRCLIAHHAQIVSADEGGRELGLVQHDLEFECKLPNTKRHNTISLATALRAMVWLIYVYLIAKKYFLVI